MQIMGRMIHDKKDRNLTELNKNQKDDENKSYHFDKLCYHTYLTLI